VIQGGAKDHWCDYRTFKTSRIVFPTVIVRDGESNVKQDTVVIQSSVDIGERDE
jgi:hypothetical protein